jgi:hypothetical protein
MKGLHQVLRNRIDSTEAQATYIRPLFELCAAAAAATARFEERGEGGIRRLFIMSRQRRSLTAQSVDTHRRARVVAGYVQYIEVAARTCSFPGVFFFLFFFLHWLFLGGCLWRVGGQWRRARHGGRHSSKATPSRNIRKKKQLFYCSSCFSRSRVVWKFSTRFYHN